MGVLVFYDTAASSNEREARELALAVSGSVSCDWTSFPSLGGAKLIQSFPESEIETIRACAESGGIVIFACPMPAGLPKTCLGLSPSPDAARRDRKLAKLLELGRVGFPLFLESFLSASGQHLFCLSRENEIMSALPMGPFLGFDPDKALGRDFSQLYSCDSSFFGGIEKAGPASLLLCSTEGIVKTVGAMLLPPSALPWSEASDRVGGYLLLSQAEPPEPSLGGARMPGDMQADMARQRTMELEAANEQLQLQASELKNTLDMLENRNAQMIQELNLASELQKSLLPKDYPQGVPLEFTHKYIPLSDVGGDFFDVVMVDATKVGIVITDVSGHGVAPAFITAMFKSAFNHFAPKESSPAAVMNLLNKEFSRTLRTEHYLTGFYAIIDTETLECVYCNAGHPKQLLLRADGSNEELGTMGFFIGMFEKTEYEDRAVQLGAGDCLCLFTDGIVETRDASGGQFGREGIVRMLRSKPEADLAELSDSLMSGLIQYMEKPEFEDDITFIAARIIETL